MKRPRTVFGPFAVAAALLIGFALGRTAPHTEAPPAAHAQPMPLRAQSVQPILPPPAHRTRLILPVGGVHRVDLADTWGQARAEGRRHEGIDILPPHGAEVRAVADGRIVKFFDSVRGGVTIYQFDTSERLVYYYAHLASRAPGLAEGDQVRQGQVIGAVGMTGNAPIPHLHFEIQRLTPEKRWWRATSMNPYPYLMRGEPPA